MVFDLIRPVVCSTSRRSKPLGLACAACLERLAGVFASRGACMTVMHIRPLPAEHNIWLSFWIAVAYYMKCRVSCGTWVDFEAFCAFWRAGSTCGLTFCVLPGMCTWCEGTTAGVYAWPAVQSSLRELRRGLAPPALCPGVRGWLWYLVRTGVYGRKNYQNGAGTRAKSVKCLSV